MACGTGDGAEVSGCSAFWDRMISEAGGAGPLSVELDADRSEIGPGLIPKGVL